MFVAQNCPSVTTINVATGVYKPAKKPYENGIPITTADGRDVCFFLRDSLKLYGGFPPGGGKRDVQANTTTLSGDIGVVNDASDNAYHVVMIASAASITPTAAVDGFTITGGKADNNTFLTVHTLGIARNIGGGIYARYGKNNIANNFISGNSAASGAGIGTVGGPGLLTATSNSIIHNTISNNTATTGGGLYTVLCTNTLMNNSITNNTATNNGGGAYINGGTTNINHTTIGTNKAGNFGGGIYAINGTDTLTANSIIGNTSVTGGGGLYSSANTITCVNTVFTQNTTASGGGAFIAGDFNDVFTNNTLQGNTASAGGGGLYTNGCINFQLRNNIFWDNKKGTDATVPGSDYYEAGTPGNTFTTNLLQLPGADYSFSGSGSYDLGVLASGNIYATDPNFVNAADPDGADNINRTADDGLRIPCSSAATEAGSGIAVATDILGNTRNGSRDMGAYESNGAAALNTLPTSATTVSLVQTAGVMDYTSCLDELVKIDGSNPYTILGNTTAKVWIESSQPATYVKRHYEITPANNAGTATGSITLYFTQPEFDDFNAVNMIKLPVNSTDVVGKSNLRVHKISGTSSDGTGLPASYSGTSTIIDPADTAIIWNSTASRWEVSFNVTGFSGFFTESFLTVLPLHWLSITGSVNEKDQPTISWHVNENSVAIYTIEKSVDGNHFAGLATINSKGNGDNQYSFTDRMGLQGIAYFRVKQTGIDGTYNYSSIVRLSAKNTSVRIYPNPVKDVLTISTGKALTGTTAVLTDIGGKTLQRVIISHSTFTIDMSRYTSGLYILKLDDSTIQKIIKE